MGAVTEELHAALLSALGGAVRQCSNIKQKPLCIDLAPPNPPRLRVYMYTLVGGAGTVRPTEYKAVLRVPGQPVGEYDSFDHSDDRLAVIVGYRPSLDVFVVWDASLHDKFKNGGNIQVRDKTVHEAAAIGRSQQYRPLSTGVTEIVFACQSSGLLEALDARVTWTGGIKEGRCAPSPS